MNKMELSSVYGEMTDREKELLLYNLLKDLQSLLTYPIIVQDPKTGYFTIKSGGTKQGVYAHMIFAKNRVNFILKEFFEESEDGIE